MTSPPIAPAFPALAAQEWALEVLRDGGVLGFLTMLCAAILLIVGGVLLAQSASRRAFALFALAALIPAALGMVGSLTGNHVLERQVSAATQAGTPPSKDELAQAQRQVRLPASIGLVASAPLLTLALMGLLFARRGPE